MKRQRYVITVEGIVGDQTLRGLRALLKRIGRAFGLRCIGIREETSDEAKQV